MGKKGYKVVLSDWEDIFGRIFVTRSKKFVWSS